MNHLTIEDVCEVVRGSSPRPQGDPQYYGGSIPRLMVADLTRDGMYVTPSIDFLTEQGARLSRPMRKGDLVIAVSGNPGLPAILNYDACIHDGFVGLRNLNEKRVNKEFLYYYLLYKKIEIKYGAVGAIFKNLTTDQIKTIEFPKFELIQQNKIVLQLREADIARQKRKAANALTDQFLQSIFLSMFGDPITNDKKWELQSLSEICYKITDGTHKSPTNTTLGEYKYITAKNIKRWGVDLTEISYVSKKDHHLIYPRCNVEFEDVLYIKDGVTTGIAVVNSLKEQFSMLSSVALLKCNRQRISPFYLSAFLNNSSVYERIRSEMGGAAITRLTLEKINGIKILVPPLDFQQKFASMVAETEQLRQKQKQSEIELENLFQALLQKHFG